ncbi:hypothetical protein C8Q74DRAFT_109342 [Fomes fomentarius]|nr:hypothetical protein C8Q74DRAFT_109342 [Fomes fomentarius]
MPTLNHLGTNLPWKFVFASILEDAVPGVTTYFDCEFVRSRPDSPYATVYGGAESVRGTASLLVLLPVELTRDDSLDGDLAPYELRGRSVCHCATHSEEAVDSSSEGTSNGDAGSSRLVLFNLSDASSDATLYDVEDADDDSEISIEVEIHDDNGERHLQLPELFKLPGRLQPEVSSNYASMNTEYSSAAPSLSPSAFSCSHTSPRSPTRSCQSHSSSTSSSSSSAERPPIPWTRFDSTSTHALQRHILPSPFYPRPLVPLLCVADEGEIVPLMCSALHQRHALGLDDSPIVGLLIPRLGGNGSSCEVLFGWIERQVQVGHTLPRTHIVASKHNTMSTRSHIVTSTVFNLQHTESIRQLAGYLSRLGMHLASTSSPSSGTNCPRSLMWRADSFLAQLAPCSSLCDERIVLWAHQVRCANETDDDDLGPGKAQVPHPESRRNQPRDDLAAMLKLLHLSIAQTLPTLDSHTSECERTSVCTNEGPESPSTSRTSETAWARVCAAFSGWTSVSDASNTSSTAGTLIADEDGTEVSTVTVHPLLAFLPTFVLSH